MTALITKNSYFRPDGTEHKVVPVCEYHLTDCKWEEDKSFWFCPICSQEGWEEDYREDAP